MVAVLSKGVRFVGMDKVKLLFQRITCKAGRSFFTKTEPASTLAEAAQKQADPHNGRHATIYSCAGPRLAPDEEPYSEDPDQ